MRCCSTPGRASAGPPRTRRERTGVRPVLAEPERGACRAAATLFPAAPVVQADATALPCGDASADLAWCLGVLCTASGPDAQRAMLRELRRIVRPAGRIGVLVYVALTAHLDDPPAGNHFPARSELSALLEAARLEVVSAADARACRRPRPPGGTAPPPSNASCGGASGPRR